MSTAVNKPPSLAPVTALPARRDMLAPSRARVAARGIGAVALAIINPLLALIPLIDAGPGKDSDCDRILHGTSRPAHAALK
jgi:hypothetical protein